MATRVRVINEGPHYIIVGTPKERYFIKAGVGETIPVGEGLPIVITEFEADQDKLDAQGDLILPKGFKQ